MRILSLIIAVISIFAGEVRDIILVANGSFSPITVEHIHIMELAKEYLNENYPNLKVVAGLLSPVNDAYRKPELMKSKHRIEMAKLAVANSDWLSVDSWEAEQEEYKPTVKVLEHMLESNKGKYNNLRIMLVCGADIFDTKGQVRSWSDESLKSLVSSDYGIVMLSRDGSDIEDILRKNPILDNSRDKIIVLKDSETKPISSSLVRKNFKLGLDVSEMVDPKVEQYLKDNELIS